MAVSPIGLAAGGLASDKVLPERQGFAVSLLTCEERCQAEQGVGVVLPGLEGPSETPFRLMVPSRTLMETCEIDPGLRKTSIAGDSPLVGERRLLGPPETIENVAEVERDYRVGRIGGTGL